MTEECDVCQRVLWDGGHATNEAECDRPRGEVCLLWQRIHDLEDKITRLEDKIADYIDQAREMTLY